MSVLQAILRRRTRVEDGRARAYAQLVTSIASGKKVDEATVDTVLDGARKTAAEFQADVTAKQLRLKDAATVAEEPQYRAHAAELTAEKAEITRQFHADLDGLRKKYGQLEADIDRRQSAVLAQLNNVMTARRRLLESSPPELADKIGRLNREAMAIENGLANVVDELNRIPAKLEDAQKAKEKAASTWFTKRHPENAIPPADQIAKEIERLEQRKTALEVQVTDMRAKAASLRAESDQLSAKRLEP